MGYEKNKRIKNAASGVSKGSNDDNARIEYNKIRFVRIELTEDERRMFHEWQTTDSGIANYLDECLNAGYTVKFSTDTRGSGRVCTISSEFTHLPNAGLRLSGRGATAITAAAVCAFKDTVICGDRLWAEAEYERGGSYQDIG